MSLLEKNPGSQKGDGAHARCQGPRTATLEQGAFIGPVVHEKTAAVADNVASYILLPLCRTVALGMAIYATPLPFQICTL